MGKMFLSGVLVALVVALAPNLASAQKPAATPVALVQSFYVPDFNDERMPLSIRLKKHLDAAIANSRKIDAPVSGLDFAWTLNAQDSEPGFEKTVRIDELKHGANAATVRATFRNGARAGELHYEIRRENGNWVVDEIRSLRGEPWVLSQMLDAGAKEKP